MSAEVLYPCDVCVFFFWFAFVRKLLLREDAYCLPSCFRTLTTFSIARSN